MQIPFIKLTFAALISSSIALSPLLAVAAEPFPVETNQPLKTQQNSSKQVKKDKKAEKKAKKKSKKKAKAAQDSASQN